MIVIPEVAKFYRKWEKVDSSNFSTHNYKAHKEYTNVLANLLLQQSTLEDLILQAHKDLDLTEDKDESESEQLDKELEDQQLEDEKAPSAQK